MVKPPRGAKKAARRQGTSGSGGSAGRRPPAGGRKPPRGAGKPPRGARKPMGASSGTKRKAYTSAPNILLLILSIVAGILLWALEKGFYAANDGLAMRPLVIGVIFGAFCLALSMFVLIYSVLTAQSEHDLCSVGLSFAVVLLGSLLVFGLATLFQWIYGLNIGQKATEPTSYIFVIDDSGSMTGSDPDGKRYDAIAEVLEGMDEDFPYMVYGFSDSYEVLREMAPISDGIPSFSGDYYGGTAIRGVLTQVMDDYDAGNWEGGESPKVILLSDGAATDTLFGKIKSVLKRYAKAGISISTVGLGSSVDESMMTKIANSTGGVYISVDSATDLSTAMASAAVSYANRDLLSERYMVRFSWVYGILRVIFLAILGLLIGGITVAAYGHSDGMEVTVIVTVVTALLGALLMELFVNWLLLWILLALTLVFMVGRHFTQTRVHG